MTDDTQFLMQRFFVKTLRVNTIFKCSNIVCRCTLSFVALQLCASFDGARYSIVYRLSLSCVDLRTRRTTFNVALTGFRSVQYYLTFFYEYKCSRFIHGYNLRTLTVLYFNKLGWVNVENRPKQCRLNHFHKIYNKKCPS